MNLSDVSGLIDPDTQIKKEYAYTKEQNAMVLYGECEEGKAMCRACVTKESK